MAFKLMDAEQAAETSQESRPQQQPTPPTSSVPGTTALLARFVTARPEVLSMSFLTWLGNQEAVAAPGHLKQRLAQLCERLVVVRELQEQQRFEQLHQDVLRVLGAGDPTLPPADPSIITYAPGGLRPLQPAPEAPALPQAPAPARELVAAVSPGPAVAAGPQQEPGLGLPYSAMAVADTGSRAAAGLQLAPEQLRDPRQYAAQLAEAVTGRAVAKSGYGQVYDALLVAAPPTCLSPEGLALAHKQAGELAQDLADRRRRSVASLLGRMQVTPEQAAQLMAGSAVARILDLLLALPDAEQRVVLLPECFTPPPAVAEQRGGAAGPGGTPAGPSQGQGAAQEQQQGYEATEELWCTPAQLLSEIDARLQQMSVGPTQPEGCERANAELLGVAGQLATLPLVEGQLAGDPLWQALADLRVHVNDLLLERLEVASGVEAP